MSCMVASRDARQHTHRVGGGGLYSIVGVATAGEEVISWPRHVVPGDDAEQFAVAEIVAGFLLGRGMAELRF